MDQEKHKEILAELELCKHMLDLCYQRLTGGDRSVIDTALYWKDRALQAQRVSEHYKLDLSAEFVEVIGKMAGIVRTEESSCRYASKMVESAEAKYPELFKKFYPRRYEGVGV